MAPSITNISPLSGSLLSANRQLARRTRIAFTLTVDAGYVPIVRVKYGENPHALPVIYDGTKFSPLFALDSTIESDGDAHTFSIIPRGGWWRSFSLMPGQMQVAYDQVVVHPAPVSIVFETFPVTPTYETVSTEPITTARWEPEVFAGLGGSDAATASLHWGAQDDAGGTLAESLSGDSDNDLVATSSAHRTGVVMPGVYDGSDLSSFRAAEINVAGDDIGGFRTTSTNLFECTQSWCIRFMLRVREIDGTHYLITKRSGNQGWGLLVSTNGGGDLRLIFDDGPNSANVVLSKSLAGGAIFGVQISYDHTTKTAKILTPLGEATADLSSLSMPASGLVLAVGGIPSGGTGAPHNTQVSDIWGWVGAAAETAAARDIGDWFKYGADPNAGTATEETGSYTGVVWAPIGNGVFAPYSGDAGQIPIAQTSRLSALGQSDDFGRWCMRADTDLLHGATWTEITATLSDAAADLGVGVTGFTDAPLLTASANGGGISSGLATTEDTYWAYVWVAGVDDDVSGTLSQENGDPDTIQTFTAPQDTPTLVRLSFTGGQVGGSLVTLRIDDSGKKLRLLSPVYLIKSTTMGPAYWGAPMPNGSVELTQFNCALSSEDHNEAAYTLDMWSIPGNIDNSLHQIVNIDGPAHADRLSVRLRDDGTKIQFSDSNDGAGDNIVGWTHGLVTAATDYSEGLRFRLYVDSQNAIDDGVYSRTVIDDSGGQTVTDFATAPWTAGDNINSMSVSNSLHGILGQIHLYDEAEAV